MVVQKGDFIKLSYTGKLENGTVFDTTDANVAKEYGIYNEQASYGPETVIVGKGFVVAGLDEDLIGKDIGDKGTVTIPPEKGFGLRRIDQIETIPVKKFKEPIRPGVRVNVGGRTGTVESISGGRARVNFNSPLAGETLNYEYTDRVPDREPRRKDRRHPAHVHGQGHRAQDRGRKGPHRGAEGLRVQPALDPGEGRHRIPAQELEGINDVIFQETYKKEEKPEALGRCRSPGRRRREEGISRLREAASLLFFLYKTRKQQAGRFARPSLFL